MLCFAVKDEKSGAFLSPFFIRHVADAIRSLKRLVDDKTSGLGQFTEDYSLWRIGEFNESTGEFVCTFQHEVNLVTLKEVA